jgi:uncharacterized cofD-like protein
MFFNLFKSNSKRKLPKNLGKKRIVCIGGGTGQFSVLSGLKEYAKTRKNITAIVTTMDSGGSSGVLRTQYGILPPGDIRNCMVALSEETEDIGKLFQYRFDSSIKNHNFGNLLLTALCDITGSFEEAIKVGSRILRIKGRVLPVSLKENVLMAKLANGSVLEGEELIDTTKDKLIEKVYLKKKSKANPRAIEALLEADIIIFGPGDLYTSIIPNLLFTDIIEAIRKNKKAKKVLISSVMSKPGETDNHCVSDFKSELEKYLKSSLTHVIANSHIPTSTVLVNYRKENKHPIPLDENNLQDIKVIKGNFIDEDLLVRHSPKKLAKAILRLSRRTQK